MKMKINKEENFLITGYGKEWALTEERLHENCIINFYDICSYN